MSLYLSLFSLKIVYHFELTDNSSIIITRLIISISHSTTPSPISLSLTHVSRPYPARTLRQRSNRDIFLLILI